MSENQKIKLWVAGDLNAFFGLFTNVLLNTIVLTGLCLYVVQIPSETVFGRVLPALGIALPFGTHGLETLLRDSKEPHFLNVSRNVFIPVSMIEKVSRKVVYLKGCDIPFKVSVTYSPVLIYSLYEYLTVGIEKWCVQDYICWKVKQQLK